MRRIDGSDGPAGRRPYNHRSGEPSISPGLLGRPWRPSVARSAWSFSGNGEGVDHADRASGGLHRGLDNRFHGASRGVPGPHLCARRRVAGRSFLHKYGPGTSRRGAPSLCPAAASASAATAAGAIAMELIPNTQYLETYGFLPYTASSIHSIRLRVPGETRMALRTRVCIRLSGCE